MRLLISRAALVAVVATAACASTGVPPGGPVDTQAPQIVQITPDSGKTGVTPAHVVFRFDEVVSERPPGAASLNALFLISPRDGDPRVDWHRDALSIRGHKGWKKNTTYTITMLPGLSDLRGNTRNTGAMTTFSTGSVEATSRITGTLFNWAESRPIQRGIIEARQISDTTLVYVASPDSVGDFVIPHLPPGQYRVRGYSDDNTNRGLDPREPYDTVVVNLTDSSAALLYAFVHDSLGSRLQAVTTRDSVTLQLQFDNPLSISQTVTPAMIHVRAPDSTEVGVLSVAPPPPDTSATARRLKRAAPPRILIVKLVRPLRPKTRYRVRVTDVRNLTGVARTSEQSFEAVATVSPPAAAPPVRPPPPPPAPIKR